MTADPRVDSFLARVVPWPVEDLGRYVGYVNLHWTQPRTDRATNVPIPGAKPVWVEKPFQTLRAFTDMKDWAVQQPNTLDTYFCLSLQGAKTTNAKGKDKAIRLKENALAVKAVWLDLDVKCPGKVKTPDDEYDTLFAAVADLQKFMVTYGLPRPTAIIQSGETPANVECPLRKKIIGEGGGLQCYWIFNRPLTPDEWRPYAEGLKAAALKFGLKCDAGCTSDIARVLRVPGTWNSKITPRRPTKVMKLAPTDYDPAELAMLATIEPVTAAVTLDLPYDPTMFPKRFVEVESLAEGLEKEHEPIDVFSVAKECAFFREALRTGGKGFSEPLWRSTLLGAAFFEHGETLAHKMGNKHEGYTPDSTNIAYARAVRAREKGGLGWPRCGTIHSDGFAGCAKCPHFASGKSPLNYGHGAGLRHATAHVDGTHVQHAMAPGSATGTGPGVSGEIEFDLPAHYITNAAGFICRVFETPGKGGQPPEREEYPIFHKRIRGAWAQSGPDALNFVTERDVGNTGPVHIKADIFMAPSALLEALNAAGCYPTSMGKKVVEEFIVSYATKIQAAQKSTQSMSFGWIKDEKEGELTKVRGFVYGGVAYRDDGTSFKAGHVDPQLRQLYGPKGSIDPWFAACKMVTDRKRPEFDAIIASSFAAPLMRFANHYSGLLSVTGQGGSGKSTATMVALAVWGDPKTTKDGSLSTTRYVIEKMGRLRNLPIYWDEVSMEAQAKIFQAFMVATDGSGPGRLNSELVMRAKTDWQTIMVVCSNNSLVDYVATQQKTTSAGLMRILEYKADKKVGPGQLTTLEAGRFTQALEDNYGNVGARYAKLLGSSPGLMDTFVTPIIQAVATEVKEEQEERFWTAIIGTIVAGGMIANKLGATLDIPAMRAFLIEQFYENRKRVQGEANNGGTMINTMQHFTNFLKAYTDQSMWTDSAQTGRGRVKTVRVIKEMGQHNRGKPTNVQWVVNERLLLVSTSALRAYLAEQKVQMRPIQDGLKDMFKATFGDGTLAKGTQYNQGREWIASIPVPPGSPFEEQLYAHTAENELPPDAMPGTAEPNSPRSGSGGSAADVETGIAALDTAIAQAHKDVETLGRTE